MLLMYASGGLGVLTKGPVAAALPGLVFGIYLVVHGEWRRVREIMIPAGVVVVLAIVVPWYAALYHRYGWTYITSFFVGENVAREENYAAAVTARAATIKRQQEAYAASIAAYAAQKAQYEADLARWRASLPKCKSTRRHPCPAI